MVWLLIMDCVHGCRCSRKLISNRSTHINRRDDFTPPGGFKICLLVLFNEWDVEKHPQATFLNPDQDCPLSPFVFLTLERRLLIIVPTKWPNAATSYSSAEYTSHFSAIYFSRSWPSVSHHENAITPTPPKLLLIAADKSSMRSTIQRSDDGNDPNKSNLIVQKKNSFHIYALSTWAL